jgi:hypothetical protein
MEPESSLARIALVCPAKAGCASSSILTSAPSLMERPKRSDISRARRSNETAWLARR